MNHTRIALPLIIIVYLCVGVLYALKTPDWQVPDEPAHYNYVRALAQERRFPVLETGDYDQDYLSRLTSQGFPPQLSVGAIEYEDHQPPLYYLLATPVYLAFGGALLPLRLFSVLIGAGVVLLAYAVAATVFPHLSLIQLGTAASVAFLPQHVALMAGVNNDSLAELLIGVALWMTVRWINSLDLGGTGDQGGAGERQLAVLGVVLGLGLVTKTTVVSVALAVFVALLLVWRRGADGDLRALVRHLALVFGPALFIAALWWIRNLSVYGGLDIYGLANHDAVVVGQPRTADWIRDQGLGGWLERGLTFTFQSFWGQFGWMGVLMPTWLYRALGVWSGMLALGFLYWLRGARKEQRIGGDDGPYLQRKIGLIFLAATVGFVILAYLYYNRTFVQHQGRYLFPALIPIALAVALATDRLLRLLRLPHRLRPLAFATPYVALVVLDLYALWRFIIPALT